MRRRPRQILEPNDVEELLRGWLLHSHKARDRHEIAARRCDFRRYWFGGLSVALSAIAGSSAFAASGGQASQTFSLFVGGLTIAAGVSAALQTFLDFPARAAANHEAAVKYKAIIRELEELLTGDLDPTLFGYVQITDLRGRLDTLEQSTPVADASAWWQVEDWYKGAYRVGKAVENGPPMSD